MQGHFGSFWSWLAGKSAVSSFNFMDALTWLPYKGFEFINWFDWSDSWTTVRSITGKVYTMPLQPSDCQLFISWYKLGIFLLLFQFPMLWPVNSTGSSALQPRAINSKSGRVKGNSILEFRLNSRIVPCWCLIRVSIGHLGFLHLQTHQCYVTNVESISKLPGVLLYYIFTLSVNLRTDPVLQYLRLIVLSH